MKHVKLYLEQIENIVVMRVLEQEGIDKDLSLRVKNQVEPGLDCDKIYLRGTSKLKRYFTSCFYSSNNKKAKEYLEKVIGWLDDVFAKEITPKVGEYAEFKCGDEWEKRIFLADLGEKAYYRYLKVDKPYEYEYANGENFDWACSSEMRPIKKSGYDYETKTYEGWLED